VLVLVLLLLPHDDTSVKSSRDLEVAHPTARKRTNQGDGKVLLHSSHSSSQAKRCNFFFFAKKASSPDLFAPPSLNALRKTGFPIQLRGNRPQQQQQFSHPAATAMACTAFRSLGFQGLGFRPWHSQLSPNRVSGIRVLGRATDQR
jgi:hypothetical protein